MLDNQDMGFSSFLYFALSWAIDCSQVKDFRSTTSQTAEIHVSQIQWQNGVEEDKDLCSGKVKIPVYDVRGREAEAYQCLKSSPQNILQCSSLLNGKSADLVVVPAIWIRKGPKHPRREYRFHAYVSQTTDTYVDLFARSLSQRLHAQNLIVEGALRYGPKNPGEGHFVRVKFAR